MYGTGKRRLNEVEEKMSKVDGCRELGESHSGCCVQGLMSCSCYVFAATLDRLGRTESFAVKTTLTSGFLAQK